MHDDIILDILLRLPVKSLIRFKCVCKSWRTSIEDPNFIEHHYALSKSNVNRHKIFITGGVSDNMDNYFYSVDAPLQHDSVVSLLETPVPGINTLSRVSFISYSSNGIILIVFPYDLIILWNPATGESRKIPSPIPKKKKSERRQFPAVYGFGYVSSIDDYKIFRVGGKYNSHAHFEIELFSTKSNAWKLIGMFSPNNFCFEGGIVTIDGIVYMIEMADLSRNIDRSTILSFSLENEQFEYVLFPDQIQRFQDPILYVLGENLCLTRMHNLTSRDFEVWHMIKDGSMNNIWSKILTIPSMHCGRCLSPVCLMKIDGYIMLLKHKGDFEIYNSDGEQIEIVEVPGLQSSLFFNCIVPYVESLFSPKQRRI
ncbi:F-box/kelch-repeat protein At3g06240-like [Solanum lycopersicum]|uniref:F-box domain-containing protein n=1 Tax=Solanum lycopersicum TaxID=4081 RepID=A0A3Q7I9C9_SOLLC|nr:F-box/kelch-repeat protein At3g06240-like [Solanum lycopersicum]